VVYKVYMANKKPNTTGLKPATKGNTRALKEESQRQSKRIMFTATQDEFNELESQQKESGHKSLSAFIRNALGLSVLVASTFIASKIK